jgi:hypothetical protein
MRLQKQKGFALITLIIAMVLMAALGVGIYTLTTSSTFSELLATRDYNAYQLAKAGLRYAAFNSLAAEGEYCMSGGLCFKIALDTSDPTVKKFTSTGYVNKDTFLAANRQLAYNMPNSPTKQTIGFNEDMPDYPQPTVGFGMNEAGAVTVDYTNKEIRLGDGTAATTDSFGSAVYGGNTYLGNCVNGKCDFGTGIHAYFKFNFYPEDSTANSTASADGFTFAIFSGIKNEITATGGVPPDVPSLGEMVGYAGPGTQGPGWQPPKMAIEFDSYPNTNDNSITLPGSRRDPTPFHDHMALILWGENHAAPYRTDSNIANAFGLRCAPNDEFVRSLYRSILGRNAELGGLQGWTSGLNAQATTATQNAARDSFFGGFFGSGEYTGRGRTDVQYVSDVFRAVLGMQSPTVPTGSCPAGQFLAQYYNNRNLAGNPTFTRCEDAPINYEWGNGGPGNGVGNDNFSVRWSGQFLFAGSTTFTTRTDDGVRLYVDGAIIINDWNDQAPAINTATRTLDPGFHPVVMEYYENGGGAVAQLSWGAIDRTAFLNAVLASTQYTNNVANCGAYAFNTTANMGTYNCGGVSRVSTSLDCSGLPLSLYNRDTLDDNVHYEGFTESSFTALPLSPQNAGVGTGYVGNNGTGYYEIPDRTCASSGSTCRGFEDGYFHDFRIEVIRDTTPQTCSRDYTGNTVPPATSGTGNCYNYRVKAWIDCNGANPTGCTTAQLNNMKNVVVAFTDVNPQIDRLIELPEARHNDFNKMIFGWTGATGQPGGGTGQKVTLRDFELYFRTPQACPAVTSITPVSASFPGGTVGTLYSPQTLGAEPISAAPFTWAVISGSLPAGLSLSPAGIISGTPTSGGAFAFTVRATNTCGASLTKAYTLTINPGNQTIGAITFTPNTLGVSGTTTASATATSGLVVTFSSLTPSFCTTSGTNGSTVTGVAAGLNACTIAANQAGNASYNPAPQVTGSITVKAGQTIGAITFAPSTLVVGGTTTASATSSSGLTPVTFSSLTTSVCTSSGTNGRTVTGVTAGTCTIAADQAGNATYGPAPQVIQDITVGKGNQATLTVNATTPLAYLASQTLSTSGGSGTGAVTYIATGSCTVSGNLLTATSGTGSCSVTATKAADANYNATTSGAVIVTLGKISQATLTVYATTPLAYLASQTLSYSGGSGTGAVTYSAAGVGGGSCTVSGATLTATSGTGACNVTATKAADDNYNTATSAAVSVTLQKATATVTLGSLNQTYNGTPRAATATTSPAGLTVTFTYNGSGTAPTNAGSYTVVGTISDTNYQGSSTGTLTITQAGLTITAVAKTKFYGTVDPALTYTTTGLVSPDTMSGSLTRVAGTAVGTYAINQGTVNVSTPGNYTVTYTGANLTITPAGLTITAVAKTKFYGTVDPALTYTTTGLVSPDTMSGSLTRVAGESVGDYAINQGSVAVSAPGNYTITYTGANLTISYRCSGGTTITTSGVKTVHTFTASGTLSCPTAVTAEVLVVGGGGAGGGRHGGGGGGGGLVYHAPYSIPAGGIAVTVGAGGNPTQTAPDNQSVGGNGSPSTFAHPSGTIRALGGGGGGSYTAAVPTGGGSGGGGGGGTNTTRGLANQTNSGGGTGYGQRGGNGSSITAVSTGGGGGGGAGANGSAAAAENTGGNGGIGRSYSISGSSVYYAGGGGGGGESGGGTGGLGGGGTGGNNDGTAGVANTGGGGGGVRSLDVTVQGKQGGSGIVIISY